mgnify:CR=1 FL=1
MTDIDVNLESLDSTHETVSDAFVEQVRQVLRHLYDLRYLQAHPLAAQFMRDQPEVGQTNAGLHLQRVLLATIRELNHSTGRASDAPHARTNRLLHLHYEQRETVQDAARQLGISSRQAHRDLRRGEETIATLVFYHLQSAGEDLSVEQMSSPQAEIAQLVVRTQPTDLHELIQRAREAAGGLAAARDVKVTLSAPTAPIEVSTDPVIARQILIGVLSGAIRRSQLGQVRVTLEQSGPHACVIVRCCTATEGARTVPIVSPVTVQLAQRLEWTITETDAADGTHTVSIEVDLGGRVVLVIDDNAGLVKMIERYLADQDCIVLVAMDGVEGIELARQTTPDAIVLDVMMPGMDGWEVLQWIRNNPRTADVPVVVCSVIDDPELAYSLGATLFLRKPVTRGKILASLSEVGAIPSLGQRR